MPYAFVIIIIILFTGRQELSLTQGLLLIILRVKKPTGKDN